MSFHRLSALVVLLAGLVYYFCIYRNFEEVIIETKFGSLKGFKAYARDGRAYNSFTGIPYAKPPIKELRFQPSVENGKWEGLKDATHPAPLCHQADLVFRKVLGQEDCLYLNVFTPKLPKKNGELLPVLFWIHGGYFAFGGTDLYSPDYFMEEDIVLVTIHYRLGALGFLTTGDDVVSGNMGLKDQLLALKWVNAAIQDFGGNPKEITIFGESAGGASVNFHMLSPMSRGLFRRGISDSGNSLCPWADVGADKKSRLQNLAKTLSCPTGSSELLVKCLRGKESAEIVETQKYYNDVFYDPKEVWTPTLESPNTKNMPFLTVHPRKLYEEGRVTRVPWMTGANSAEGCWRSVPILTDENATDTLNKNWAKLAPNCFHYGESPATTGHPEKIMKFYFGESKKSQPFTFKEDYERLTEAFSDRWFLSCLGEAARANAKYAPTYLYYFSRPNPEGLGMIAANSKGRVPVSFELLAAKIKIVIYSYFNWDLPPYGTCHADELGHSILDFHFECYHLFHFERLQFENKQKSFILSASSIQYPDKFEGVEWTKAEANKPPRYFSIGKSPPKMIEEPFTERVKFWESLRLT